MARDPQSLSTLDRTSVPLTRGLVRNTFSNLIGWIWPTILGLLATPYIVSRLGNDAYGVFGIVSILAGYLNVLQVPFASANVRFVAEAYGRREWPELRGIMLASMMIIGLLSGLGALTVFLAANVLAERLFKIPRSLVETAVIVLRIGAASFFLNAVAETLRGIPAAIRRWDIVNVIGVIVNTLRIGGIILAIWLGWGLVGAVMAQFLASVMAVVCFGAAVWWILGELPSRGRAFRLDKSILKPLFSFSTMFFVAEVGGIFSSQVDRTLVGALLGTTALTFYIVPTRITDKTWTLMTSFCVALYPLSAEALATSSLGELRQLYIKAAKSMLWFFTFLATILVVSSREILLLWMGPDFAANSRLVLVLLASASVWHASSRVAHYVCTGLGRADISMWIGWGRLLSISIPVAILTPILGINGAALGLFIGMFLINVLYDLIVQRRLIGQSSWRLSLSIYAKPLLVGSLVAALLWNLSSESVGTGLILKATLTGLGFVVGMLILDRSLVVTLRDRFAHLISARLARGEVQ